MLCPLCKAEYRMGYAVCSGCRAALVPGHADANQRNPPQLRWITQDRAAFELAAARLREAGIPCREHAQNDHWLHRLARKRAIFMLFILERDAGEAAKLTGMKFAPIPAKLEKDVRERCPLCRWEFPGGGDACPGCGADLLAWRAGKAERENELPADDFLEDESGAEGRQEVVWQGSDPVTFGRVVAALREAGILYVPLPNFDHMVFDLAIPRPRQQVRTYLRDAERAHELLRDLQDPFPLIPQEPPAVGAPEQTDAHTSEPLTDSAEPITDASVIAEFERRKRSLRWGLGLNLASGFLFIWVAMRMDGLLRLHFDLGSARAVALSLLFSISILCGIGAYGCLFRAWGRRADKIGMLAWLFFFQMLPVQIFFLISISSL